jgi:hypothetical protein
MRSPSSASAINNARSWSGGMISASTGPCAWASTQSRSPRQLRQFAHECARAVSDDWLAATRFEVLGDIDLASQDDGETKAHFTDSSQRLSYAIGADLAEPTDPLDFRRFQSGEHLVASRIHDRLLRYRHD